MDLEYRSMPGPQTCFTPRGPVYGHGGWISGYVSSLRHYADHEVTVAFQINTDAGIQGSASGLVPELESALADLALAAVNQPSSTGIGCR